MSHHLLPVKHFHLIFTLPHELNDLIFYNKSLLYGLLFRVAWQTIQEVIGVGKTGMVATLHSWGSNLSFHPHLHCIVAGGSFKDGKWQIANPQNPYFFCDGTQLHETFKELFLEGLLEMIQTENLRWGNESIDEEYIFPKIRKMYRKINRKKWSVRIENPVLGVEQIIEYLSRYVRRVAITNSRIEEVSPNSVTINYKQYHKQKPGKAAPIDTIEMEGAVFIQRFSQHFMPRGFHKVRYYGCYSFGAKRLREEIYQHLTAQPIPVYQAPTKKELVKKMLGHDMDVCTNCGMVNSFVTKTIATDTSRLFILTRPISNICIRAGPRASLHRIGFVL